tara:strand:+ start:5449 stop:6222 length:774 start_codon:yes stop_codon:yes gene_type:complete
MPVAAIVIAFHGSLQHELIHNHPFKNQKLNDFLGHITPIPWLPYALYKISHMDHHSCPQYSHPEYDPETFLVSKKVYDQFSKPVKKIFDYNQTLLGRLILGPFISMYWIIKKELKFLLKGDFQNLKLFIPHYIVWFFFAILFQILGISLIEYIIFMAIPGYSVILIRSFLEHRPETIRTHQTCIVEAGPFFSFLFLNNNLHLVHHNDMNLPWYEIPRAYQKQKEHWLNLNGHYFFKGYREVFRQHLLSPTSKAWVEV